MAMAPPSHAAALRAVSPAGRPRCGRVAFGAVLLIMLGVAETIAGTFGAIFATLCAACSTSCCATRAFGSSRAALISVVAGFFVVLLLLGVLHVVAAAGVLAHRRWGRWLGILLCAWAWSSATVLVWRFWCQAGAGGPRGW